MNSEMMDWDEAIDIEVECTDEGTPDTEDWERIEEIVKNALDETPYRFEIRSRPTGNEMTVNSKAGSRVTLKATLEDRG
ncbi:MAG: hypothetical protein SV760_08980 [Halobacteria archaeon]|nr:hypothetical protein [Halobacteria archaeon]